MAAHRYWRLRSYSNDGDGTYTALQEFEMRTASGGADVTTGMTAYGSTPQAGTHADLIDDDLTQTGTKFCQIASPSTAYFAVDFGAANEKDIVEVKLWPMWQSGTVTRTPRFFHVQWSDTGGTADSEWTDAWACEKTGWVIGTPVTFTKPAVAAHRYWRMRPLTLYGGTTLVLAEIEMRETVGGVDATGSGTPIKFAEQAGDPATDAFDNNTATLYASVNAAFRGGRDNIGYDFGSGITKTIAELFVTARNDSFYTQSPASGWIESSADLQDWVIHNFFSGLTWTAGSSNTITGYTAPITYNETLSDGINVVDQLGSTYSDTLTDGPQVTDNAGYPTGATYSGEATDSPGVSAAVSAALGGALSDTASVTAALLGGYAVFASDGPRISAFLRDIRAQHAEIAEDVAVEAALAVLYGIFLAERLPIAQTHIPNQIGNQSLAETIAISELIRRGYPEAVAETVGVAATQVAQLAITTIEGLGIAPAIASSFIYNKSTAEGIGLAAAIARFFGADAVDGVSISETMAGVAGIGGQISETIGIAEAISPLFILRAIASDTISIDDTEALQMLFSATLADGIELAAAYLSPGESIITWAMNTRTAAVTEYSNYAFNSFARMGNKYLGASESGLYELLGNDDAGASIVATIRSGFAQWSGTHLGSFKAAYLAVRGAGVYVLKVITADGRTYNYSVTAESMKTVKVNMGKGLRARYFAFELVTTGQDFDLDTLEFIPLVAQRRV